MRKSPAINKKDERLFSPIKPSKLPDKVYKQIVSLISSGKLNPGDKIPSERDLANELEISRQSIREALNRAEAMGLIEIRQGEGSFILSSIKGALKTPLTLIIEEEAERVFDFLEMRKVIEGWCVEKAAEEATFEELEKMESVLSKMKTVVSKNKQWEVLDLDLHLSFAKATHNVFAVHMMEALKSNFGLFFQFTKSMPSPEKLDVLWQHHHEIFLAIKSRDPGTAKHKLVEHLDFIAAKIKEDMGIEKANHGR